MSRKQPKRRAGRVASAAIAGFFILVIAGGVGFGVASADSSDDLARAGAFGFDEATHTATLSSTATGASSTAASIAADQHAQLASVSERDISSGLRMVDSREAADHARSIAENAAVAERVEAEKAKQGVVQETQPAAPAVEPQADEAPTPEVLEYNLPAVDWSVGKDEFIAEWTARIDAYLAGSPLEGYGSVFADAAWNSGIDPRWSPAISNTESSKGENCFLSHNAWGWGSSSWPDWETAIRTHVIGLASTYGYSVTLDAARKYCPPNYVNWYNNTVNEMATI